MLSTREAVKIGRRGGRARTRNLSPQRRREIAQWARLVRGQKSRGELTTTEFVQRLVEQLRASDPDLASYVQAAQRLPLKYQCRILYILSPDEQETLRRVGDDVASSIPRTKGGS